jgi:hypothetical protein
MSKIHNYKQFNENNSNGNDRFFIATSQLAQYEQEQLNIPVVSGSLKKLKKDALNWSDDMTQTEWDDIERKHGYYGHDITEQDIIDIYKIEINYQ